ncbi:hypothetical protein [Dactylosporangium sp. CA-092794]|uniref:hypothetical protein n=1 Tax=Dactylosporangium sp. CA-092794 TaxID=3239929 RepID=UPI003D8EC2D4
MSDVPRPPDQPPPPPDSKPAESPETVRQDNSRDGGLVNSLRQVADQAWRITVAAALVAGLAVDWGIVSPTPNAAGVNERPGLEQRHQPDDHTLVMADARTEHAKAESSASAAPEAEVSAAPDAEVSEAADSKAEEAERKREGYENAEYFLHALNDALRDEDDGDGP